MTDHVSIATRSSTRQFPRSERVAPRLQVGRFPVDPVARDYVSSTFAIAKHVA